MSQRCGHTDITHMKVEASRCKHWHSGLRGKHHRSNQEWVRVRRTAAAAQQPQGTTDLHNGHAARDQWLKMRAGLQVTCCLTLKVQDGRAGCVGAEITPQVSQLTSENTGVLAFPNHPQCARPGPFSAALRGMCGLRQQSCSELSIQNHPENMVTLQALLQRFRRPSVKPTGSPSQA